MAKATNLSTTSRSRFHAVTNAAFKLLGELEALLKTAGYFPNRTKPDPKAWRVTRDGDVILPNRKIELRARSAAKRMAAA